MRSSRMTMMTAKQRRNKTANTTKQFQICSDSVVSRNSPGAEGRAELSFVWAACGATCALRCGICIGVLTEAEDEADVKSEQFGQERGAQALPKPFVVETCFFKEEDGGLASLCLIEHEGAFMRCRGAKVSDAQDLHLG